MSSTRTVEEIATLDAADLRGRWLCVVTWNVRPELPGERFAMTRRAMELGLEIKGVGRG